MNTALASKKTESQNLVDLGVADRVIAECREKFAGLSADSPKGYKEVVSAIAVMRNHRVGVEKARKELKAEVLERGRLIDGEAKRVTAMIVEVENPLIEMRQAVDDEKARIKREIEEKRLSEERAKLEAERAAKDEAERKERERIAEEQAAEAERLRVERENMEAEKAEIEKARQKQEEADRLKREAEEAKLKAFRDEIDKERQKQEAERRKIEAEREAIEKAKREEAERIEREKQAEIERIEAEKRAKEQAEREEAERKRREAENARLQADRKNDKFIFDECASDLEELIDGWPEVETEWANEIAATAALKIQEVIRMLREESK